MSALLDRVAAALKAEADRCRLEQNGGVDTNSLASAAIRALRPSVEEFQAAYQAADLPDAVTIHDCKHFWVAMIDEALR